jgi:hypothetical protein
MTTPDAQAIKAAKAILAEARAWECVGCIACKESRKVLEEANEAEADPVDTLKGRPGPSL